MDNDWKGDIFSKMIYEFIYVLYLLGDDYSAIKYTVGLNHQRFVQIV